MAERLFGLETEYAFALRDPQGRRIDPGLALEWLMESARRRLRHLPGFYSPGIFLENGARFYVDCGAHPELTTPECANPWDAARYLRAGDQILLDLAQDVLTRRPSIAEACFFRHNVDYSGRGSTWGSHESYLHRADPALFPKHLIPHLVSRLIYTGAGGFDSRCPGIHFVLSPRVPHLETEVSGGSTNTRGILHTRDETLSSQGYHRLHLLCSESLYSELAIFLRVGATALIVAMIEAGLRPGDAVELAAPLQAMRGFANDPPCRITAPDKNGRPLTAIQIQRHYLQMAEAHVRESFMPPWAPEVCRRWRAILDLLEDGAPHSTATRLDWAVKCSVIDSILRRRGSSWETLHHWTGIFEQVVLALQARNLPLPNLNAVYLLAADSPVADVVRDLTPALCRHGLGWESLKSFLALREELFEIDTRFAQVGDAGLFSALERAGVLEQHFPGVDNIEHAVEHPPAIGRAGLRGRCVRRFGCQNGSVTNHAADWTAVWDYERSRLLDLSDPFAGEERWQEGPPGQADTAPGDPAFLLHIQRLRAHLQRRRT